MLMLDNTGTIMLVNAQIETMFGIILEPELPAKRLKC